MLLSNNTFSCSRNRDRANIALYDVQGLTRRIVTPDGGRFYSISGRTGGDFSCSVTGPEGIGTTGYGGVQTTWAESTWSATALGLNLSGEEVADVQIDVYYATDGSAVGNGFSFDNVQLTNARLVA